jgi:hypothetical protein
MPIRNTSIVTAPNAASPPDVDVAAAAGGSDGGSNCGTGGTKGVGGEVARVPSADCGDGGLALLACGGAAAILDATGGGALVDDGDDTGGGLAWTAPAKSIAVVGTQKEPGLPVVPR